LYISSERKKKKKKKKKKKVQRGGAARVWGFANGWVVIVDLRGMVCNSL
jgi:hypothetical protein